MQSSWASLRLFENAGHCFLESHLQQKFCLSFCRNPHREENLRVTCAKREETPIYFSQFKIGQNWTKECPDQKGRLSQIRNSTRKGNPELTSSQKGRYHLIAFVTKILPVLPEIFRWTILLPTSTHEFYLWTEIYRSYSKTGRSRNPFCRLNLAKFRLKPCPERKTCQATPQSFRSNRITFFQSLNQFYHTILKSVIRHLTKNWLL